MRTAKPRVGTERPRTIGKRESTLRIVAGLEPPDAGEVWLGGRRIDGMPPGEHNVAMVFQHCAGISPNEAHSSA